MAQVSLFGVNLPSTNRLKLRSELRDLKSGDKATLYFLYSEFLLRANWNLDYQKVLNRATFKAIDGRGLHWSMWCLQTPGWLPGLYRQWLVKLPTGLRQLAFYISFIGQLLFNLVSLWVTLVFRFNLSKLTNNELVLGREFVYDLLLLGETLGWKTLIIAGDYQGQTKDSLAKLSLLYPKLDLTVYTYPSNSKLMQDIPSKSEYLNSTNLLELYPELELVKHQIVATSPDLILVCLGGASGKQEFFIDHLQADPQTRFTLAVGLGAALDHLGVGTSQPRPPKWLTDRGLEWLYRFIFLPYRRKRVWQAVVGLWWLTTLEQFVQTSLVQNRFVNLIRNQNGQFLVYPDSLGANFPVENFATRQSLQHNYWQTKRKTGLDLQLLDFAIRPVRLPQHRLTPVSLASWHQAEYKFEYIQPFLCSVDYTQTSETNSVINPPFFWLESTRFNQSLSPLAKLYWQYYEQLASLD